LYIVEALFISLIRKLISQGQRTQEHNGLKHGLVFFVSILKEFNSPRYRGPNGWVKEDWNDMAQRMNGKFVSTNFIVCQLKDREQRLKKDYNAVKLILSKSGFGWNTNLNMATTVLENWDELPQNLQRWKDKSFPYYDDLVEIYNGNILSWLEKYVTMTCMRLTILIPQVK
jgi:hypothetical protein